MTIEILSGDLFEDHRGKIFSYFPEDKIVEYNLMVTNAGDERGYHYHPHFNEYVMIVQGSVEFTAYSESKNFTKVFGVGDSFKIPKNVPHTFKALEDLKFVSFLTHRWHDSDPPIVKIDKDGNPE